MTQEAAIITQKSEVEGSISFSVYEIWHVINDAISADLCFRYLTFLK